MALKEYKPGTTFPGRMGLTIGESEAAWPVSARAKEGAPNVIYIVIDDTGFGHLGCYGSAISTPNFNKLAANGLLYTNMHTTALCSPSRSCPFGTTTCWFERFTKRPRNAQWTRVQRLGRYFFAMSVLMVPKYVTILCSTTVPSSMWASGWVSL
jgi:hypothetical protein